MDTMFWIWLGVIVTTAIIEFATMEIVSIWFTAGAILPFILSGVNALGWQWQIVIFVVVSAVLIFALRPVTKKWLLKGNNEKTNVDSLVGKKFRLLARTDFETIGSLKVNDVVWSAMAENQATIEKGEVVEIVKIDGNKLIVKKAEDKIETKVLNEKNKNLKEEK